MDKLEKLFNDQREAFEEEPSEGHFIRFEHKLDQYHAIKKRKRRSWPFLKIAAVLIILLLSANLATHLFTRKTANTGQRFANNELNETAHFYNIRINSGMSQLKQMADQGIGSKQELMLLKKEMNEMDSLYLDLQSEYSKNPHDERIVNAMIEYYQAKLNIINTIKSDLENVKTFKNRNHENTEL